MTDGRSILHVTNGDLATEQLRWAKLPGNVLPWRDVLQEGPVHAGLDPAALAAVRARFIAGRGWAPYERVLADVLARDEVLAHAAADPGAEIVLWFESDLYDQLQLLQVLDRLADRPSHGSIVSLVEVDPSDGAAGFVAVAQLERRRAAALHAERRALGPEAMSLAVAAWRAFTGPDPGAIERVLAAGTAALPSLGGALRRLLAQYPATHDGLARTERLLLEAVATGAGTPLAAFRAQNEREERPFLGDTTAWTYLADLGSGDRPLLRRLDGAPLVSGEADFARRPIRLTDDGRAVLAGCADRVALIGLDRWIGGVHLTGPASAWRWDEAAGRLVDAS